MSYGQPCSRMTGAPSAGPSSAYAMFRTPASICFSAANEMFAPAVILGTMALAPSGDGLGRTGECIARSAIASGSAQRTKRGPEFFRKELRLFPGGEVPAARRLVEVGEGRVAQFDPT